jgi:hypothetical protein
MSILVTFRKQLSNETREVEYSEGMSLPRVHDRIVSPFDDDSLVTVIEVISDAPRNCYEIQIRR